MAYIKQNYQPGDVLTAEQVNKIQDTIIINEGNIEGHIENTNNPHGVTLEQIGAAPAGYGLGGMTSKMIRSVTELDGYTNGGWYFFACPGSTIGNVYLNYGSVFVHPFIEGNCVQELRPLNTNTVLRRFNYNGTWSEWEVENPPMLAGVEYRTTRRWRDKAVYTKLVDFGLLPSSSVASIDVGVPGLNICSVTGSAFSGTTGEYCPIPMGNDGAFGAYFYVESNGKLGVRAIKDMSRYSGVFVLEFTKD